MRMVADRAAVSPGTPYTYFTGKEELFAAAAGVIAVVRDALARFEPGFAAVAELDLAVPFVWASLNGHNPGASPAPSQQ